MLVLTARSVMMMHRRHDQLQQAMAAQQQAMAAQQLQLQQTTLMQVQAYTADAHRSAYGCLAGPCSYLLLQACCLCCGQQLLLLGLTCPAGGLFQLALGGGQCLTA